MRGVRRLQRPLAVEGGGSGDGGRPGQVPAAAVVAAAPDGEEGRRRGQRHGCGACGGVGVRALHPPDHDARRLVLMEAGEGVVLVAAVAVAAVAVTGAEGAIGVLV